MVHAGLLASTSQDVSCRSNELWPSIQLLHPAFPWLSFSSFPSDRLRCPRLQLRGSAGFAPASHRPACCQPTIMREPNFEKEQKQRSGKSTGHCDTKSNGTSLVVVMRRVSRASSRVTG